MAGVPATSVSSGTSWATTALADHSALNSSNTRSPTAFVQRAPRAGVIFHSHRGCRYTSGDFAQLARTKGVVL
jgi:transposase InsO family protein